MPPDSPICLAISTTRSSSGQLTSKSSRKRCMAGVHQLAHFAPVRLTNFLCGLQSSFDFRDDVTSPSKDNVIHSRFSRLQHPASSLNEGWHSQERRGLSHCARRSAYSPPVNSCFTLVLMMRMETLRVCEWDQLSGPRAAVQQKQMSFLSHCRSKLVHNPASTPAKSCSAFWAISAF